MKLKTFAIACLLAVVFARLAAHKENEDRGPATAERLSIDPVPVESELLPSGGAGSLEWTPMYRSDLLVRQFRLDGSRLLIQTSDWDPSSGSWIESVLPYRASFSIRDVDTRGATELYLLGTAANGDDVIEQWIIEDSLGSYTAARSRSTTPFGTPSQEFTSISTVVVGGGPYQPDRLNPEMSRTELYRGDEFAQIQGLAPDVDGRFLHFAGGDSAPGIYTLGLFGLPPATPTVVVAVETLPELASCDDLYVHYSSEAGWTWWVNLENSFERILAIDSDNDGVPTTFDLVSDEQLLNAYGEWEFERHDWWPQ